MISGPVYCCDCQEKSEVFSVCHVTTQCYWKNDHFWVFQFRHVPSKSKVFSFDQHIQNFRERVQAYYTLMDKSHKWCYHKLVKCAANYQEKPLCFTTLLTNLVIIALKLVG